MSMRNVTSVLGLCLVTAVAGLLSPAAAQQWVMPRTPDGHPDLQGNWNGATLTPFERALDQGPVFTADEVAQLEQWAQNRVIRRAQPLDPDRPPPTVTGGVGPANDVYLERGTRVAVINGEPRTSLITVPPDGRRPPLTPEAQWRERERREFMRQFGQYDHPELRPLGERCIILGSPAGPPMIPNVGNNQNYTIVQTADYVMIHVESMHDTRIIRFGEPNPLPEHVRPWFGDSWGRWEGDVLVVETTNIHPQQNLRGPHSEHVRVIERFTRFDEETILYEFTVDDPTTYTQPWGGEVPFRKVDHLLYEYACHEGNYSMAGILSGARYQERREAQNQNEPR